MAKDLGVWLGFGVGPRVFVEEQITFRVSGLRLKLGVLGSGIYDQAMHIDYYGSRFRCWLSCDFSLGVGGFSSLPGFRTAGRRWELPRRSSVFSLLEQVLGFRGLGFRV